MDPRHELVALARDCGFHAVRFARVRPTPRSEHLDRWLMRGRAADLAWIARDRDPRVDPRHRAPWARTAIALAVSHHHRRPPDPGGRTGMVARYAWGRDYHNLVGKRLKRLRQRLDEIGVRSWGGVDTAPILERAWAEAAGLGFSGKNTMQILPGTTSYFFLAIVFVDVEVEPDPILGDHCKACTRCLRACPTGAFAGPRDLDAGRCVSYWTIEARELAPEPLRAGFGRWVFGCDVCQEVCPHNHDPDDPDEDDLLPRHAWLDLDEIVASPDEALLERFTGTPLRRPGAEGLKRNALVALANLGDPGARPGIERNALRHPDRVVREAAAWALDRLGQ
jgi:epoxyqueuosine reductase